MTRRSRLIVLVAGIAAAVLVFGIVKRELAFHALQKVSADQSVLPVEIMNPQRGPTRRPLQLPGTVSAWYEAPIFAQVAGYVLSWKEDYGARVKAGQLLATIDAPTVDAQYAAAKASLDVAKANYQLAVTTARRWQALAGTPAVAQQEVDVQVAAATARKAELAVAEQNVARYAALEGFKRVTAPFDGVVTARLTSVGDYVNVGGGDAGARSTSVQLFNVADVHALRVFVAVPEGYANALVPGLTATLHLPSAPGKPIPAKFLTTAKAFNENTRTAVTELVVEHPDGSLWPGAYVDVAFEVPNNPNIPTLPEQALIFLAAGTQVAIVDKENRVHLRSVTLGHNLGEKIQVTAGISIGDKVVNNPPAGLLDGQLVSPVTPMAKPALAPERPQPPGATSGDGHRGIP
jgi:membrane fusion protein, multidrug efflux system